MNSYLITYDLLKPNRSYEVLHQAILALDPSPWHGLESVWVIVTHLSAPSVRNWLSFFVDRDDRLLVLGKGFHWAGWNLPASRLLAENTQTLLVPG